MSDHFTKKITLRMLSGKMSYEAGQKAFADPEAFKAEEKRKSLLKNRADGGEWPGSYRYWGKLKSARLRFAYCWGLNRNKAGYFLGWREVYDAKGNVLKRDQFVSRRVKKRLKELQQRRHNAAIAEGVRGKPR